MKKLYHFPPGLVDFDADGDGKVTMRPYRFVDYLLPILVKLFHDNGKRADLMMGNGAKPCFVGKHEFVEAALAPIRHVPHDAPVLQASRRARSDTPVHVQYERCICMCCAGRGGRGSITTMGGRWSNTQLSARDAPPQAFQLALSGILTLPPGVKGGSKAARTKAQVELAPPSAHARVRPLLPSGSGARSLRVTSLLRPRRRQVDLDRAVALLPPVWNAEDEWRDLQPNLAAVRRIQKFVKEWREQRATTKSTSSDDGLPTIEYLENMATDGR